MNEKVMKENVPMLYDTNEAVRDLNKVDGFEPKDYLSKEETENGTRFYLETKYRLLWYRLKYEKGKLMKIPKTLAKDHATFEVRVYADINDPVDNFLANGFGSCYENPENKEFGMKFVECAETIALGRALRDAGFGTQFCDIAIPNDPEKVDAPVTIIPDPDEDGIPAGIDDVVDDMAEKETAGTDTAKTSTAMSEAVMPSETGNNEESKPVVLTADMPVEKLKELMTFEYAKKVVVTDGCDKGRNLGDLAVNKKGSVQFHAAKSYNNLVKAAAQVLLEAAQSVA